MESPRRDISPCRRSCHRSCHRPCRRSCRRPCVVATFFNEGGVATACSCRDIFSVKLTSRHLIDVATFWSLHLLCSVLAATCCSQLYHQLSATSCSFLLQFLFSFEFPAAQKFGEVYSRFLHINQSFYIKINHKNGLKIDDF